MRAIEPCSKVGMYGCSLFRLEGTPDISVAFGPVPKPLPVATSKSLSATATASVYHSVGTKPMAGIGAPICRWPSAKVVVSNTATESVAALAANRRFPSLLCAKASVSLPENSCFGRCVEKNALTLPVLASIAATESALARATYKNFSSGERSIAVGCEPGATELFGTSNEMRRTTVLCIRSSSAICEAFHKLHHARRPSRVATTVYGKEEGMKRCELRSNCASSFPDPESSRITLSDKLLATSSWSFCPDVPEITASPAG